ncbi:hypothetical protein VXQ18_01150 [Brucella abortus]|nr:hypothetical protein [Brucella abortus]
MGGTNRVTTTQINLNKFASQRVERSPVQLDGIGASSGAPHAGGGLCGSPAAGASGCDINEAQRPIGQFAI